MWERGMVQRSKYCQKRNNYHSNLQLVELGKSLASLEKPKWKTILHIKYVSTEIRLLPG